MPALPGNSSEFITQDRGGHVERDARQEDASFQVQGGVSPGGVYTLLQPPFWHTYLQDDELS
jgi:hypothetical protein